MPHRGVDVPVVDVRAVEVQMKIFLRFRIDLASPVGVFLAFWFMLSFVTSGCAKVQSHPEPTGWPGGVMSKGGFCPAQKADEFDDLGAIRAAMRQLECLIVVYENRPEMAAETIPRMRHLYSGIVEKLTKRNRWDDDSAVWEWLYTYTARLNPIRNELARHFKIPVFSVNGHHRAAALWAESARRHPVDTLVHFDSHSDTRGLADPARVLQLGRGIMKGTNIRSAERELDQYLNDPAVPCSVGILLLGFKHFIWPKPDWYGLGDVVMRPFFYGQQIKEKPGIKSLSKNWELYYDRSADTTGRPPVPDDSSWMRLPRPASQMGVFDHVRRLTLSVFTTSPWPKEADKDALLKRELLAAIHKGNFVLDIDLDYFGSVDLTPGLSRKAPPSHYEGRNEFLKPDVTEARRQKWLAHRQHVDKAIAEVEAMMTFLRRHGRIPTVVTLADSTYMPFSIHWWSEEFWEYGPRRMLPYVQYKVRKMLARVYAGDGIGAIP